jgi:uncharacterized protein YwgA
MSDLVEQVASLVRLNGEEMVGRTRLQKTVYLLEAKGIGVGVRFDYHKHGPYSAELAFATEDAISMRLLRAEEKPGFYEIPYTVFRSTELTPPLLEDATTATRKHALRTMKNYSALVLELAATAVYLREHGYRDEYWKEVKKRKSLKASVDRLERARTLLGQLKLEPPPA